MKTFIHILSGQSSRPHGRAYRWLGLITALLALISLGRSTVAEFETPFVDTTNGINNVEFHGVWAFNRGFDTGTVAYNRYEAFAVGIDPSAGLNSTNNGAMYFFDGTKWSRVPFPFANGASVFSLNAIAGQLDPSYGTLNTFFVVGPAGKMAVLNNGANGYLGSFGADNTNRLRSYGPFGTSDLYAVDAIQEYSGAWLAGGANGTMINSGAVMTGTPIGSNETITGIKFANNTDAYITSTIFPVGVTPFQHNCAGTGGGSLWKYSYVGNTWTKMEYDPSNCFYGLATAQDSSLHTDIWVATEHGVARCIPGSTATSTCANNGGSWSTDVGTTNGKPQYSVVALNQRAGSGTNLLQNGNFDLAGNSFGGWVAADIGTRWYKNGAGTCTLDPGEIQTPTDTNTYNGVSSTYVKITQRALFKDSGCSALIPSHQYRDGLTVSAVQTVPFSTIEGQRYRISGDYKVDFPSMGSNPAPNNAQGGIDITCGGSNVQDIPTYINCSVSDRKLLLVRDTSQPNNGGTDPTVNNGWKHFDITISREDGIFNVIDRYPYATLYVSKRRMDLQVRCEATYGATVSCDNLKVEPIDDPSTQVINDVTVISAGRDIATNGMSINDHALTTNIFELESVPNKVRLDKLSGIRNDIYSMFALSQQHVYAAGQGYTAANAPSGLAIFDRTPTTLQGSIWVGAYSPVGVNIPASTGQISVSCIDDRGADNSQPTLCQRVPESYGMSLEITSTPTNPVNGRVLVKTGKVTGHGWFGSPPSSVAATDTLDLGTCQNSLEDPNLNSNTSYANVQSPNLTYSSVVNGGACGFNTFTQSGTRRCKKVDIDGNLQASFGQLSCLTSFDCLGRCEKDSGFLCLKDSDCKITLNSDTADTSWADSGTYIGTVPSARLACGTTPNGLQSSPLACTPPGWLSFEDNDFPAAAQTPPSGSFGVTYNTHFTSNNGVDDTSHNILLSDIQNRGAHELAGWARFMTLTAGHCSTNAGNATPRTKTCSMNSDCSDVPGSYCLNSGWVRLRGDDVAPTGTFLLGCRNCDGGTVNHQNCAFCQDSSGHSCVPSDSNNLSTCYSVCKDSPDKNNPTHCAGDAECGAIGPCIPPGYCSKDPATYCQKDQTCSDLNKGTCVIGEICNKNSAAQPNNIANARCAQYGVNLDTTTGKFVGNAWSQDFGWLNFQDVSYGGARILQTRLGDIYATGQIGDENVPLPPGGSSCNATYLITSASSITNFCSASGTVIGGQTTLTPNSSAIPFPTAGNVYQNVLGRFDLVGIEKNVGSNKNKYGSVIVQLAENNTTFHTFGTNWQNALVATPVPGDILAGKVYVIGTPATLAANTTFKLDQVMKFNNVNVNAATSSGAGVLIVNGNLDIAADSCYDDRTGADPSTCDGTAGSLGNPPDPRGLASLTVVVKGDLTIENPVQNIVGAYYVTGAVNTATDIGTNQFPLTVRGLMIASQFHFKRQFAGTIENPLPSELIIYDGRLQSNPMPGLTDFASALPNSVSVAP